MLRTFVSLLFLLLCHPRVVFSELTKLRNDQRHSDRGLDASVTDEDEIHVDEFEIGTPQKGEQGRSKSDKKMRNKT